MIAELQKDRKPAMWGESSREGAECRVASVDTVPGGRGWWGGLKDDGRRSQVMQGGVDHAKESGFDAALERWKLLGHFEQRRCIRALGRN